jgi:hypothetical protein
MQIRTPYWSVSVLAGHSSIPVETPTFWMFSITRRRLAATAIGVSEVVYKNTQGSTDDLPSTITIRLRKPRKLGVSVVSWLRHDGFDWEWTACTWRYLLRNALLNSSVALADRASGLFAEPLARVSGGGVVVVGVSWAAAWPRRVTPWSRGVSMLVDSAMVDVVAVSISMLIQYFDIGVGSQVKKRKEWS